MMDCEAAWRASLHTDANMLGLIAFSFTLITKVAAILWLLLYCNGL